MYIALIGFDYTAPVAAVLVSCIFSLCSTLAAARLFKCRQIATVAIISGNESTMNSTSAPGEKFRWERLSLELNLTMSVLIKVFYKGQGTFRRYLGINLLRRKSLARILRLQPRLPSWLRFRAPFLLQSATLILSLLLRYSKTLLIAPPCEMQLNHLSGGVSSV